MGRPATNGGSSSSRARAAAALPSLILLLLSVLWKQRPTAAATCLSSRAARQPCFVAPSPTSRHHRSFPSLLFPSTSTEAAAAAAPFPAPSGFLVTPSRSRRARAGAHTVRRAALPLTFVQDVGGAALVAGAAGVWLKLWTTLATAGKVDSKDSRKIIHCGSGPLFLLCWPFFSPDPSARLVAAAVPLLQIVAVALAGLSKHPQNTNNTKKPAGLVAAISRSGNPAEVLRGPLIYVFVLLFATLLFWRTSPVGLVAVAQMAAGDGMADIVGRRWGRESKWPFSATKSYAGTAAFVLFGFLVSVGLIAWFHLFGLVPALTADVIGRVAVISIACALVELVPLGDDNVTVPVAAAVLSTLLLQ